MSKYRRVRLFLDTDSQIAIVAMETVQLVLSQLKNFLMQWIQNWMRSPSGENNKWKLRIGEVMSY